LSTEAPQFTAWLDDFFRSYYRHRPVDATFIGVHQHDERLPDYSANGVGDARADAETLLGRLRSLPAEPLSRSEALDRLLAEGFLAIQRWELDSTHFHRGNPCLYTGEAIFGILALFLRDFAPFTERAEAARARMEAIPLLLSQARANLRHAPRGWTERAIRECQGACLFLEKGVEILAANAPPLRAAAERAAASFSDFESYLEQLPVSNAYACGGEAFHRLLQKGHFLPMDAAAIEVYAAERLSQYQAQLEARAREMGASSWRGALECLMDDHPAAAEYYSRYEEVWRAAREAALEHDLVTWPEAPIRYLPQPDWARPAAPLLYFLSYRSPAPFDRLEGTDYLVPPIEPELPMLHEDFLRSHNNSVIKLNHVIHHGGLGHHVQNHFAYRAASRIGQVAAVDCASRIAFFCGGTMAEGWAGYATDLMEEMGFLTPLESLAELHSRLRMAARALLDVRLHHGHFDWEQAEAFYRERVGMTAQAARAEVVKNSMFPGTALMYLLGRDAIHELRREMAAREGAGFSLRRFHDRLLSYGSIPVSLVSEAMRKKESQ
jgi:hypothetical protein